MTYIVRETADKSSQIRIVGADGLKNIDVQSEEFFHATLGNLLYYLNTYSNRKLFNSQISNSPIKKSMDIIREWIEVGGMDIFTSTIYRIQRE